MSDDAMMTLKVNDGLVRPVIEKQIQAAIVSQMANAAGILESAVAAVLRTKVNKEGKVDSYAGCNTIEWLEFMASDSIKKAARLAMDEWLAANRQKIVDSVRAEMNRPGRKQSIAKAFCDAVERAVTANYTFACNVTLTAVD
jgi:hypothetical protein